MAGVVTKSYLFDGTKSIELNQYPPEAWTWLSGSPENESDLTFRNYVPWLARARQLRVRPLASMPFVIMNKAGKEIDSSDDYQNVTGLIPSPTRFFARIEGALLDYGRCYYLKAANKAKYVKELKYFVPPSVEPVIDPIVGLTKFIRSGGSTQVEFLPEQMLYFWPDDSAVEIGPPLSYPLKSCLAAAGILLNVDNFAAAYWKRGAIKATILSVKGNPPQAEKDRLKNWWQDMVSGIKNAFASNVFNAEAVEATQIGEGLEGLTDTNLLREQKEAICAGYGIPFAVMFSDAANYATASSDWRGYYETTILPEADFIAEVINEQLLDALGYHLQFAPESLDVFKTDETERAGALVQLTNAGIPLILAMDILGFELTDEQRAELDESEAEPEPEPIPEPEAMPEPQPEAEPEPEIESDVKAELARWKRKAKRLGVKRLAEAAEFESEIIPLDLKAEISAAILAAKTVQDIGAAFEFAGEQPIKASDDFTAMLAEMKRANDLLEAVVNANRD